MEHEAKNIESGGPEKKLSEKPANTVRKPEEPQTKRLNIVFDEDWNLKNGQPPEWD